MYLYFVLGKTLTHKRYFEGLYEGIGDMIPVGLIMVFALLIGKVIGELGTAQYLAELLSGNISPILCLYSSFGLQVSPLFLQEHHGELSPL